MSTAPITDLDLVDAAEQRAAAVDELRTARAECAVLECFDCHRRAQGYDYGSGQRAAEISDATRRLTAALRLARALIPMADLEREPTVVELRAAYRRRLEHKVRRAERDAKRAWGTSDGGGASRVLAAAGTVLGELTMRAGR